MKKILFFIGAILLFTVSCTKFPEETRIDFNAGPDVSINIHDFKTGDIDVVFKKYLKFLNTGKLTELFDTIRLKPDSTICFKINTTNDAVYFSCLVTEEDIPSDLDPIDVLKCVSSGLMTRTFKNGANKTPNTMGVVLADSRYQQKEYFIKGPDGKDSIHIYNIEIVPKVDTVIMFAGMKPFTTYQIYAVSSHKDGGVGNLSNANTKTSDSTPPRYVSRSISERIITLTFSEPVKRGDGKIFAAYYSEIPFAAMVDEILIKEDNISISENTLNIIITDEFPAGAFICITWETNAVTDIYGLPVSEFKEKGYVSGQNATWLGCYFRLPFKQWNFEEPEEVEEFDNITTFRIISTPDTPTPPISRINSNYKATAIYTSYNNSGSVTKEIQIDIPRNNSVVNSAGNLSITLPEKPDRNAFISIILKEESFIDKFGNGCNTFEFKEMYKYVGP